MAPRTRPSSSYLPGEWPEWRNFVPMMKNILMKNEVVSNISWTDLIKQNPRVKTTLVEAKEIAKTLPLVLEDIIFISNNRKLLAVFLKEGLYYL